jgi:hypothetical protein
MEKKMESEYPDSVRIFPNNENPDSAIDVSVFFRVNGEEHKLRIYKNNRKEEGDKRPDYLVSLTLNGADLEANSWKKEAKESGKIYYQGTPKPKDVGYKKESTTHSDAESTSFKPDNKSDQDIPF